MGVHDHNMTVIIPKVTVTFTNILSALKYLEII